VERNRRDGESGSPPIGLGLELGRGGSSQRPIISCKKPYGFTVLQLQELQLQSLIYTYIQARFPVPYHLVLPIWRSVATSLGGLSSRLYQLYPSRKSPITLSSPLSLSLSLSLSSYEYLSLSHYETNDAGYLSSFHEYLIVN